MNQTAVVEYNVTDAALAKMESDYMGLVVKGLDDLDGLKAVHAARMVVKNTRVDVEKKRKELKASALEWGKKVDSEAKRIFAKIEPIETHLTTEEEKITKEKERIQAEKVKKEEDRVFSIRERIDFIRSAPSYIALSTTSDRIREILKDVTDYGVTEEVFQEFIETAKSVYAETVIKIEQALSARVKFEAEEFERKADTERIAKERAELAAAQRKIEDERISIQAEKDRLEAFKRMEERNKELEQAKKEAVERAIQEAKEQAEREARDKMASELKAKEEAERQEALKPEKIKLLQLANRLVEVAMPDVTTNDAAAIVEEVSKRLWSINRYIIKAAQEL